MLSANPASSFPSGHVVTGAAYLLVKSLRRKFLFRLAMDQTAAALRPRTCRWFHLQRCWTPFLYRDARLMARGGFTWLWTQEKMASLMASTSRRSSGLSFISAFALPAP